MIKYIIIFIVAIFLLHCSSIKNTPVNQGTLDMDFTNITALVSDHEFEEIKMFVLENGDRKTYRNIDNNNPHYQFDTLDVYLGADVRLRNINNDPEVSDFHELIIYDAKSTIKYYKLMIVRKGDVNSRKISVRVGMKEEQVYLFDLYEKGLVEMKNKLPKYLRQIRNEMKIKGSIR